MSPKQSATSSLSPKQSLGPPDFATAFLIASFVSCKTCICPCVTFGQNAEIIDQGASACAVDAVITWLQYGLKASPCPDFCAHCFCHYCALCQEHRELKNLGYLMTIGWNANVERRAQQGVTLMAPVVETGMHR
ncbi:hypothetical protein COLO4_13088 [Corchorus olitorius]|uniref:PLAC8 motif-containing protein n=1 Tax=Corchorus olitorius TaxID=93759 RepID=A0A1R3JY77_9ROSI|nr:hypothetical protein COLO4_13088 [Corchorus olitorius]